MSGFDLRNGSGVVAVARQRGIDVVLDDESKYETPAVIFFKPKQLFLGSAGTASNIMNPKHTISQIKRLIGRKFSDPEIQRDLIALPYSVSEGPDGYLLIDVPYSGEVRSYTPAQVLGKVFSDLKSFAKNHDDADVFDCCIGIPVYFTDHQRKVVMDVAANAGLHPLRLMHETTAAALAYGIYKTFLPENDQLNVAFVDIGHASMQVCIAGFKKGEMKILAHSFDQSLGGRDFDEVLFWHFAATFKEEYKIDVFQNARACLRLRVACEKLKKDLSANAEAPLNIECLMEEKDVRGFVKREEFEQLIVPLLSRVTEPLEKALLDAGLSVENIHSVEVVGFGSRVPAVIRRLTEFFGKEPRRTMNASECVAKGCALQCAILSPTFKVREFQVNDIFPIPIAWSWKGSAPESQNEAENVFRKGNPIPWVKDLTFFKSGTFSIDFHYADMSEYQGQPKISTYMIGPFQSTKGERAKLKLRVCLNQNGIVSVESATLLEEDVEVEFVEEFAIEATKMEIDEVLAAAAPPGIMENDVNTGAGNVLVAENGVLETGDMSVQIRTDVEVMDSPWRAVSSLEDAQVIVGLKATGLKIRAAMNPCLSDEEREEVSTLLRSEGIVFQNKSISQVIRIASMSQLNLFVSDSDTNIFIEIKPSVDDDMYDTIAGESFARGFNILGGRHGSVKSRQLRGPTRLPKYCLALFALVGVGVCINCLAQKIKITIPAGFIQIQNHMSWRPKN